MNESTASQVRAALNVWLAAFNAKDLDALMACYDPDIVYANASAPLRRGVAQVRASFEPAMAAPGMRLRFSEETLVEGSELALIAGKYLFEQVQPNGEAAAGSAGRVVLLYRRSADGRWLLAYDADNAPPDVSAADFARPS